METIGSIDLHRFEIDRRSLPGNTKVQTFRQTRVLLFFRSRDHVKFSDYQTRRYFTTNFPNPDTPRNSCLKFNKTLFNLINSSPWISLSLSLSLSIHWKRTSLAWRRKLKARPRSHVLSPLPSPTLIWHLQCSLWRNVPGESRGVLPAALLA